MKRSGQKKKGVKYSWFENKPMQASASRLFERNPAAFSALPDPLKRAVLDNDRELAAEAQAGAQAEVAGVAEEKKRGDGLRLQLADLRRGQLQRVPFEVTRAADYRKFTR